MALSLLYSTWIHIASNSVGFLSNMNMNRIEKNWIWIHRFNISTKNKYENGLSIFTFSPNTNSDNSDIQIFKSIPNPVYAVHASWTWMEIWQHKMCVIICLIKNYVWYCCIVLDSGKLIILPKCSSPHHLFFYVHLHPPPFLLHLWLAADEIRDARCWRLLSITFRRQYFHIKWRHMHLLHAFY
jgi:hypothetical protein